MKISITKKKKKNFLRMYKMYTFSINTWSKIDVEAIKYNGEKWVNENYLEKAMSYKNLTGNRTQ